MYTEAENPATSVVTAIIERAVKLEKTNADLLEALQMIKKWLDPYGRSSASYDAKIPSELLVDMHDQVSAAIERATL